MTAASDMAGDAKAPALPASGAQVQYLRALLETVGSGGALDVVLANVVQWIEGVIPDSIGSVLLTERDGRHLRHAVASSLPPAYREHSDMTPVGPACGSSGTAAYRGAPVIVADIASDPLCDWDRAAAAESGVRACWSYPVCASTGECLGTVTVYRRESSRPTDGESAQLQDAARIVALVIERARADEARQRHDSGLRTILENALDIIIRLDAQGRYLYANPALQRLTGISLSTIVGRTAAELDCAPALRDRLADMNRAATEQGVSVRAEFVLPLSEGERWLDVVTVPEFDATQVQVGLIQFARDITARREAEQAQRRSEQRLRLVFNLSSRSIALLDPTGRLLEVGDQATAIAGLEHDQGIGACLWDLPSFAGQPESQETLRRAVADAAAGGVGNGETIFRGREGDLRFGSFSVVPVRDADGLVVELLMEGSDITDKHDLEQRLRQSEKMESLGRLAGGIAHDFNNILAAILGHAELLSADAPPGTETHEGLQHILHSSRRARDLVRQILAFSRKAELVHKPVDFRGLIVDGLRLLRASLPATIDLQERVTQSPLVVMGDASQLSQVLLNLGANAEYALRSQDHGRLAIELERVRLDAEPARALELGPGAFARLVIRDSGHGIPAHVRTKIFEPFFTTKPVGEGTGMGLAVVHGIVVAHGGAVRVHSGPQGTTFELHFPIVSTPAHVTAQRVAEDRRGSGRILVVDDEPAIVSLLQRLLPRRGFETVCFTSSVDALDRFRAAPLEFDLIITDRTMPQLSGDELVSAVRGVRNDLPVIVTSGQGHLPGEEESEPGAIFHLAKPFDVDDLMRVIEMARGWRPGSVVEMKRG